MLTQRKTPEAIAAMRRAGQVVGAVLYNLREFIRAGRRPDEIDRRASELISQYGAKPAFLGYQGYPATICISVNDVVVHGIPTTQPLHPGDVVSIDAGAIVDGYYADAAFTLALEPVDSVDKHLVTSTEKALMAGIDHVAPGVHLGDVESAIGRIIEQEGLGAVYDLTGHGIGQALHEEPAIPNFGQPGTGFVLEEGMTICLEPMVTVGRPDVRMDRDGWTIRTRDHSRSAHFEHTILVTASGNEILTEIRQ